ncbi:MAG: hypothetical protein M9938_01410 [Solirubrobacterales bacterium]|nr:hypothetical protein [Solirubrobacterales bacterium]
MNGPPGRFPAVEQAAEGQARAGLALGAALSDGPAHAYLFEGPPGSGKAALARAFSAELLAAGSADPADTRRRAVLDPSPHPDLIWLKPKGMTHAVEEVRSEVIRKASLNPFEGSRRVFVVEAAEALNDESQNAMLKTLEEPPAHAHLLLLSADPEGVLPTVASRCQRIVLDPLPPEVVRERLSDAGLAAGLSSDTLEAIARLSRGDMRRARELAGKQGAGMRTAVETLMGAVLEDRLADSPWQALLRQAETSGEEAAAEVEAELEGEKQEGIKHTARERDEAVRRAKRRKRTADLALGLSLASAWARDWICVISDVPGLAFNADRLDVLEDQAARVDLAAAREATVIISETARRFRLNVSEELALESMAFRLEARLRG